jgi:hypothetical protein
MGIWSQFSLNGNIRNMDASRKEGCSQASSLPWSKITKTEEGKIPHINTNDV